MQLKHVVLPEPFGPMRPRISPSFTSKETLFSAVKPPNCLVRPEIVNMGGLTRWGPRNGPHPPIRSERPGEAGALVDYRAAQGDAAGSGRIGLAVCTVFGNTSSNFPSWIWKTAGNARSFCPAIGL